TFCCMVCGQSTHADRNAAATLASRLGDQELAACADRQAIKALLARRHQDWLVTQRLAVVQPPAQLFRQRAQVSRVKRVLTCCSTIPSIRSLYSQLPGICEVSGQSSPA